MSSDALAGKDADPRTQLQHHAGRRRWYEIATAASSIVAALLVTGGALAVAWGGPYARGGVAVLTLSIAALIARQACSFDIDTYSAIGSRHRGSSRYERMHRWTRLKTSSSLHSLLMMLGVVLVMVAVLGRTGLVQLEITGTQGDRALALFLVALVLNSIYAHHQSLFVSLEPDRSGATRTLFWAGVNGVALLAALAAYIRAFGVDLRLGGLVLHPHDALVVLVAAFTLEALVLSVSRALPSIFSVVTDPRTQTHGGYISRTKAVAMPTIVAATLLLLFVLFIVIFGAGIFTVLGQVGRRPSILVVLGVMAAAVLAGLGISFFLARQEDKVALYRPRRSREQQIVLAILVASSCVALTLLTLALYAHRQDGLGPLPRSAWLHFASLSLLAALGPYGFYAAARHRTHQLMESRFPDLLRDLASSHKGGLTLVQAAQVAARGEYGALTPEVQRLADQLTWNVSFDEAFSRFADRVATPLVQRSVNLVLEAGRSGGNTTDVLLAAARDAREIKSLERERTLSMGVYTTVIYVTFFVFLFVIGILVGQFLPEIIAAGEAAAASSVDPAASGIHLGGIERDDYRQFYFIAGAVQAVGNGMLAGIMGSGRTALGLRHAFFMVLATYVTFGFIL